MLVRRRNQLALLAPAYPTVIDPEAPPIRPESSKTRSRRSENASPSRSQNPSRDVHAVSRRPDHLQPDCVYDAVELRGKRPFKESVYELHKVTRFFTIGITSSGSRSIATRCWKGHCRSGYERLSGRFAKNWASRSYPAFCRENMSICSWKSRFERVEIVIHNLGEQTAKGETARFVD